MRLLRSGKFASIYGAGQLRKDDKGRSCRLDGLGKLVGESGEMYRRYELYRRDQNMLNIDV